MRATAAISAIIIRELSIGAMANCMVAQASVLRKHFFDKTE